MLELIIGEHYSYNELHESGYDLLRFWSQSSIYEKDGQGYYFRHVPLKRLKIRFKYQGTLTLPDNDIWTTYDREQYDEDLDNCCSPLRLGL